ncbi:phage tail-collar fiber domain-containing protein [Pseudomonas solani]|uniref:phage tail-collar fiber domain-containing protein n=1 Tax=Pseudomonas solani TaxID=2731552 RepID=UPI003D6B4662
MGASITHAGESLIAQKLGNQQTLVVSRFVLANVPGLDPNANVDRAAAKPPITQVVGTFAVTQRGYVNPNQVVYSLMLGSDIGDFDWNWLGLESEEGVLVAVTYVPLQQKRKNNLPQQVGNNVTRNFLLAFDGAQALTGITIDSSTWQFDYTARMAGIDERERVNNLELYGQSLFFDQAFANQGMQNNRVRLGAGVAYVAGLRIEQVGVLEIMPPTTSGKLWLDVAMERQLNQVVTTWTVRFGGEPIPYKDSLGVQHYTVLLGTVAYDGAYTDYRRVFMRQEPSLIEHFASKQGTYPALRAQATTKADVGLGNLPNAKSDDPETNSSDILATTKALKSLRVAIDAAGVGLVGMFAMDTPPAGWLRANGSAVSRATFSALFARIGTRFGAGDGLYHVQPAGSTRPLHHASGMTGAASTSGARSAATRPALSSPTPTPPAHPAPASTPTQAPRVQTAATPTLSTTGAARKTYARPGRRAVLTVATTTPRGRPASTATP